MNKSIGGFVVCLLGLAACNVEHYDDDCEGDVFDHGTLAGSSSRAGSTSNTGGRAGDASSSSGGRTSDGGATSSGGVDASPVTPAKPCDAEHDCDRGYNCNFDTQQCEAAADETCGELETELACTHRSDCTPIYGGTNCSCGQDCECHGGEPGCVCQSFEFFVCRAVE